MAPDAGDQFRLAVLSPGGCDPDQYFDQESGSGSHPPVNFHGFAACTGGSFHRELKNAIAEKRPVLLLLRGNFRASERALIELKNLGRTVAVSLKETGLHQIAQQLSDRTRLARFFSIMEKADGCVGTTPESAEIYRRARPDWSGATVGFIPPPYPIEDRDWDFSVPPDEQKGILIGTREWGVPSRNHMAALLLARELSAATAEPVTVFNLDGRKGKRLLAGLNFPTGRLRLIGQRKEYREYLREVAKHKIVLQLDRSRVPGQVAGDALLARTICVGGDGTAERIAFAAFCGEGKNADQLGAIALDMLRNTNKRATAIIESQWRAAERLSFQAVRKQLKIFFDRIR